MVSLKQDVLERAWWWSLALVLIAGPGAGVARGTDDGPATVLVPLQHETSASAQASDRPWRSLGARLKDFEYPYAVSTFEVEAQGQGHEMAFMDVAPTAAPSGRTVLLLHGKNFSGAYWEDTVELLAGEGFRVVVPDQIGFGKSSKPTDFQYSFHALATHTAALLDSLGVSEVAVVGHSMGGMLATRFALMFPERTTELVLVNPIGLEDWKRRGVPYQTVDEWLAGELEKDPEAIRSYMRESYFDGRWKPGWNELAAIQAGWTLGPDWPRLARVSALTYDMIYTQPVVHELDALEVPTLLVVGTRDRTALGKSSVSEEVRQTLGRYDRLGEAAAERIPESTLVEIEGVGHLPQVEAFDRYAEALVGFLDGDR